MADAQLSPQSYLKYAFRDQHNLVVLFGAGCFSAAFASPLPLLVGVSGELLWLLVGPRLPAFRTWVDRQTNAQYLARAETAIEGALAELPAGDVKRFLALSQNVNELVAAARERLPAREVELSLQGLLELRRTFLDYLFLGQRVAALVDSTPNAELEQEAALLQDSYSAERELTVRMTIRKALTLIQKRIVQQASLSSVNRSLGLCLEMLEKALPYLKGRLKDRGFTQLAQELDGTLAEVGSAETLELAVDDIFSNPGPSVSP